MPVFARQRAGFRLVGIETWKSGGRRLGKPGIQDRPERLGKVGEINITKMADRDNSSVGAVAVIAIIVLVLLVGVFLFRWWGGGSSASGINVTLPAPSTGTSSMPGVATSTGGGNSAY